MARRTTTTATPAAEPIVTTATPVRRRRRRTVIDHAAQTVVLVASLLKARGGVGASQAAALAVVTWARDVHEETAALKTLSTRVRKAKADGVAERQVAHDVNTALLTGVLAGELTIDVDDSGNVVFGHMEGNG